MNRNRDDYQFANTFRVRYSEIDAQNIVFNAHYLTYFDITITEFLRHLEVNFNEMAQEQQLDVHTIKATVEFIQPIRGDEMIDVCVCPAKLGNSSVVFDLAIFYHQARECLACGEIIWVCAKVGEHKSHPLPQSFRDKMQPYLVD